jgi:hypothetical protein
VTSTYDASTGDYGYDVKNSDGSYTNYDTTYGDNGSYDQTWTNSNERWSGFLGQGTGIYKWEVALC